MCFKGEYLELREPQLTLAGIEPLAEIRCARAGCSPFLMAMFSCSRPSRRVSRPCCHGAALYTPGVAAQFPAAGQPRLPARSSGTSVACHRSPPSCRLRYKLIRHAVHGRYARPCRVRYKLIRHAGDCDLRACVNRGAIGTVPCP